MVDGGGEVGEDDSMDSCLDADNVLELPLVVPEGSEVVRSAEQWVSLWKWLPEWVTLREPQCIYSSSQHGYK